MLFCGSQAKILDTFPGDLREAFFPIAEAGGAVAPRGGRAWTGEYPAMYYM